MNGRSLVSVGDLQIDFGRFRVTRGGAELAVPRLSFDMLAALTSAAPNVVSIDELMSQVWPGLVVTPETVTQRVHLLRQALGDTAEAPRYVEGVRGRGYRLLPAVFAAGAKVTTEIGAVPASVDVPAMQSTAASGAAAIAMRRIIWPWLAGGLVVAAFTAWLAYSDRIAGNDHGATAAEPVVASVAVLPLENLSARPDDAYFADGIHDDILTELAQVGSLRVIARTSVEQFRGSKVSSREIGEQLGVRAILEGSVQRAGDRVRINLQLIDAGSEAHLWAEQFDRDYTVESLFAIQSEIATAVTSALRTRLTPEDLEQMRRKPTGSIDAWREYQIGRQLLTDRNRAGMDLAETHFEKAIAVDPSFARAYSGLADVLIVQANYGNRPYEATIDRAAVAADKALQLAPDLAEVQTTAGGIADERGDLKLAEARYRRALKLNPSYTLALRWLGMLVGRTGRPAEALKLAEAEHELDPLSQQAAIAHGEALEGLARFDEALQVFLPAVALGGPAPTAHVAIAQLFAYGYGRFDLAIPWYEAGIEAASDNQTYNLVLMLSDLGLNDRLRPVLDDAASRGWAWLDDAELEAAAGEGDRARAVEIASRLHSKNGRRVWPLAILADEDLAAGRVAAARARYARGYPELLGSDQPDVNFNNLSAAISIAAVLIQAGERDRADALLRGAAEIFRQQPRFGLYAPGVTNFYILALQGQADAALAELQSTVRSGWRGPYWRYCLYFDPALSSIRSRPEFQQAVREIEADLAAQRARLAARDRESPLATTPPARDGHDP